MPSMQHRTIPSLETLEELGGYLRELRESLSYSLDEAGRRLRIRPFYLQALESGNWQVLPGQAYGRGYLRQYAGLLGIPSEAIMEICDKIQGKISTRLHYFETTSTSQHPSPAILWISAVLIVAIFAGWFYASRPEEKLPPLSHEIPKKLAKTLDITPPAVIPSPYSLAAQECMKLLQTPQDPCYLAPFSPQVFEETNYLSFATQWNCIHAADFCVAVQHKFL
jgi:cytoskeleton protein RodZ